MTTNADSDADGLSAIVVFHNMRREAGRTLRSLTRTYQQLEFDQPYEVIAIDHGSTLPLSKPFVESFGPGFRHCAIETEEVSPCQAINHAVERARFGNVMILIDGARILSPGIVGLSLTALKTFDHPLVYTLGMHLGPKTQNFSVSEGYNQLLEDRILSSTDWPDNGYSLFPISSLALSSKLGFFSQIAESNCFALRKDDFIAAGSYKTDFKYPGGGLCNLELFNRLHSYAWFEPIMLLGEATFHQYHGGVATNVPIAEHPWQMMAAEYEQIVGEPYSTNIRPPLYFGGFREECRHLFRADAQESGGRST